MPTTQLSLAYRPLRLGFLVRRGSTTDVRRAIGLMSLLWGGMFNFIVEVNDAEQADRDLQSLWLDAIYPVADAEALAGVVSRHPELSWPRFGDLVADDGDEAPYLRTLDLSGALWAFERWLRAERPIEAAVRVTWEPNDPYALVYGATFGDYSLAGELLGEDVSEHFVRLTGAVDAQPSEIGTDDRSFDLRDAVRFALEWPVWWERSRLNADFAVFLGNPRSPRDVGTYWNLRATGRPVIFWDATAPKSQPFEVALERSLARLRSTIQDRMATRDEPRDRRVWVDCYANPAARVREAPSDLRELVGADVSIHLDVLEDAPSWSRWRHLISPEPPATSDTWVLANADDVSEDTAYVRVQLPPCPIPRVGSRWQSVGVAVDASTAYGFRGTLRFPPLQDLNPWLEAMVTADDGIRVGPESFTVIDEVETGTLSLRSVSPDALIQRLFARAGITAKRSLEGEVAWHLLHQLGGINRVRILRLPGVRSLLASTQARGGIKRKAAVDMINDQGRLSDEPYVNRGRATARDLLEFLASRSILLPGIDVECPRCRHGTFYSPKDLDDELRCPLCAHAFPLGPALRGNPIRFRLSGLLAGTRATIDHEGGPSAVAVLLTLLLIQEWHGGVDATIIDTSHDLAGDQISNCETDIVAISYGTRPRIHTHMLIGECKGRGEIDSRDIQNLSAIAAEVRASGVDCDVVFATTRGQFNEAELQLLRHHYPPAGREMVRPPIILTGTDLAAARFRDEARDLSFQGFHGLVELSRRRYFESP